MRKILRRPNIRHKPFRSADAVLSREHWALACFCGGVAEEPPHDIIARAGLQVGQANAAEPSNSVRRGV